MRVLQGAARVGVMLIMTGTSAAADLSPWAASYDPAAGRRFIPIELWTGAAWDGNRELGMTPANLTFGKQGKTRVFDVSCNGGTLKRRIELTIEKLDFSHEGVPHSLQFHWVVDGGRARGTDMRYIYSPGRGLASVDED